VTKRGGVRAEPLPYVPACVLIVGVIMRSPLSDVRCVAACFLILLALHSSPCRGVVDAPSGRVWDPRRFVLPRVLHVIFYTSRKGSYFFDAVGVRVAPMVAAVLGTPFASSHVFVSVPCIACWVLRVRSCLWGALC